MKQPSFDLIELFVEHPCMDHFDWCLEQEVDLLSDASRERADAATLWAAMSLAGYHMDGRNTFVLGDRQVQVFGQLDVSRVCWSELTVPYGICYIAFERPVALVKEDGATAMEMSLAGFVVAQSVDQGSEDETLRLSLTPLFLEADGLSRGVVDFLLRLNIVAGRTLEAALAEYEGGVAEASRRFFQFAASCTGPLELSDVADASRFVEAQAKMLADKYFAICFGAIAYLASTRPTTTHVTRESVLREAKRARDKRAKRKLVKRATRISDKARVSVVYPDCPEYEVSPHWRRGHAKHVWVGTRTDADGNPRKGTHRELRFIPPTLVRRDKADGEEPGARTYHFPPMRKQ